jgi:hypothetical protein
MFLLLGSFYTRCQCYDRNFMWFLPIFDEKKLRFSRKPMLWSNFCKNLEQKMPICLAKFLGKNIFKFATLVLGANVMIFKKCSPKKWPNFWRFRLEIYPFMHSMYSIESRFLWCIHKTGSRENGRNIDHNIDSSGSGVWMCPNGELYYKKTNKVCNLFFSSFRDPTHNFFQKLNDGRFFCNASYFMQIDWKRWSLS